MSDENEIEFESVDSSDWVIVKQGAEQLAKDNLQDRYNAANNAAWNFKQDSHEFLTAAITKPPGPLLNFGAIADLVVVACEIVLPEEGAVALVFEAAKGVWETVKPSEELYNKATEQFEANTIDDAIKYLDGLSNMLAAEIVDNALKITNSAKDAVGPALEEYVKQNPQDFTTKDDPYYQTLCDAIGVTKPNVDLIRDEIVNKVMATFRERLSWVTARIHFFFELSVPEQLDFLIDDVIEKDGTDPDDFLRGVGGDVDYWERFLSVYRSDGKWAAQQALLSSMMGPG